MPKPRRTKRPAIGPVQGATVSTPDHCKRIRLATNSVNPTIEWHANQMPVGADSAMLTHNQGYLGLLGTDTNTQVKLLVRMVRFMINRFDASFGSAVWNYIPHKMKFMAFFKQAWKSKQKLLCHDNLLNLCRGIDFIFTCSLEGVRAFKKDWYRKVATDFARLNKWPTDAGGKVVMILTAKAAASGNNKKRFYRKGMCGLAVLVMPIVESVGFVLLSIIIVTDTLCCAVTGYGW